MDTKTDIAKAILKNVARQRALLIEYHRLASADEVDALYENVLTVAVADIGDFHQGVLDS